MRLGLYKTFEELEESLNMEELQQIVIAQNEFEYRQMRFAASLKGIDLDKEDQKENASRLNEIKARVAARQAGMDEETYKLQEMGIIVETEDEDQ